MERHGPGTNDGKTQTFKKLKGQTRDALNLTKQRMGLTNKAE